MLSPTVLNSLRNTEPTLYGVIKTIVNKFAISNRMALILGVRALRSYLKLTCEYELHSLQNKKVRGAKGQGKNYIKFRSSLVRHLLRNRLLKSYGYTRLPVFN